MSRNSKNYLPINPSILSGPPVSVSQQSELEDSGTSSSMLSSLLGGEYQLKIIMWLALKQQARNQESLSESIAFILGRERRGFGAIDDVVMTIFWRCRLNMGILI